MHVVLSKPRFHVKYRDNQNGNRFWSLQMSTNCLLRGDMVDICLGDAEATFISRATANTLTAFVDRREVVCVFLMAKIQGACIHDGIAKTLIWY
jgi:hypothetical protein